MKFGTLKYIDVVWISSVDDSLLEKYRKYGPKIVDMIEGEFSFVLYEKDKDIICPCDYAGPDIEEHGHCYCALFFPPDFFKKGKQAQKIPERRPESLI